MIAHSLWTTIYHWANYPCDPTDAMNEFLPKLIANLCAAADCCAESIGEVVSPADVHTHMYKRAEDHPLSLFYLMEIQFMTLLIMIWDSEKSGQNGDVDLFIASLKLCLPFCASTNKYKYTKIICDFLYWWETSSPAEKVIFQEFIYTRLSQNGLPLWSDHCIDWTMGHIHKFMGKHHWSGNEAKMHRIVPEIPRRKN